MVPSMRCRRRRSADPDRVAAGAGTHRETDPAIGAVCRRMRCTPPEGNLLSGKTLGTVLSTKKSRVITASVVAVALTGTLVAAGVSAHADDVHRKQVALAAAETAQVQAKAALDKA